jgi:hypothetical protein
MINMHFWGLLRTELPANDLGQDINHDIRIATNM